MHHSDRPVSKELADRLFRESEELYERCKAGATGKFPLGKLCEDDQGEIAIRIGSDPEKDVVILDFGPKPIAFLGMTPQQAVDVAQSLIRAARAIAKEPLSVVLH